MIIQRSMLILPAHVRKFVEKAHLREADAILLDLEDAVPENKKAEARAMLEESIGLAGRGGAHVWARINKEKELMEDDLIASVHPGLYGIFLPKIETPEEIIDVASKLLGLESARNLRPGSLKLSIHIESPMGLLNIRDILNAHARVESVSLGPDDYCLAMGIEPTPDGDELLFPFNMLVTAAKASGVLPFGIPGTVAGFRDTEGFRHLAERARRLGAEGAFCVHPGQVTVLNEVFSLKDSDVTAARRITDAFEEGLKQGRAAVELDGMMIDTPVYKRARITVERAEAIAEKDTAKSEAREKLPAE
jgi:citrate lyase subunit beta/citryl-CoA lyase